MNAIPRFATRIAAPLGKRLASTMPKNHGIPDMYQNYSFRKAWLNDPATYPMIVVLSFVGTILVGAFVHEISTDKDLKLNPSIKHKIIRDYGHERRLPFVSNVANPNFIQPEGLGIDHDEWVKGKENRA